MTLSLIVLYLQLYAAEHKEDKEEQERKMKEMWLRQKLKAKLGPTRVLREMVCPATKKLVRDTLNRTAHLMDYRGPGHNFSIVGEERELRQIEPDLPIGPSGESKPNRWIEPLTPAHIMEAMRRFEQVDPNVLGRFARFHDDTFNVRKRLLCL